MPEEVDEAAKTTCAACRMNHRRCVPGCVFAPYFPSDGGDDDPSRSFAAVHRVFGTSNAARMLEAVPPLPSDRRRRAAETLVEEALARLRDPAFGCVSYVAILEMLNEKAREQVDSVREEIAREFGAAAAAEPVDVAAAEPAVRVEARAQVERALAQRERDAELLAARNAADLEWWRKQRQAEKRAARGQNTNKQEAETPAPAAVAASERAMLTPPAAAGIPGIGLLLQKVLEDKQSPTAAAQAAREEAMASGQAPAAAPQHHESAATQLAGAGTGFLGAEQWAAAEALAKELNTMRRRYAAAQQHHRPATAEPAAWVEASGQDLMAMLAQLIAEVEAEAEAEAEAAAGLDMMMQLLAAGVLQYGNLAPRAAGDRNKNKQVAETEGNAYPRKQMAETLAPAAAVAASEQAILTPPAAAVDQRHHHLAGTEPRIPGIGQLLQKVLEDKQSPTGTAEAAREEAMASRQAPATSPQHHESAATQLAGAGTVFLGAEQWWAAAEALAKELNTMRRRYAAAPQQHHRPAAAEPAARVDASRQDLMASLAQLIAEVEAEAEAEAAAEQDMMMQLLAAGVLQYGNLAPRAAGDRNKNKNKQVAETEGNGYPHQQMAETLAPTAAVAASERAMFTPPAAAVDQRHHHLAAPHAGMEPSIPGIGQLLQKVLEDKQSPTAAAQAAREEAMASGQAPAAAPQHHESAATPLAGAGTGFLGAEQWAAAEALAKELNTMRRRYAAAQQHHRSAAAEPAARVEASGQDLMATLAQLIAEVEAEAAAEQDMMMQLLAAGVLQYGNLAAQYDVEAKVDVTLVHGHQQDMDMRQQMTELGIALGHEPPQAEIVQQAAQQEMAMLLQASAAPMAQYSKTELGISLGSYQQLVQQLLQEQELADAVGVVGEPNTTTVVQHVAAYARDGLSVEASPFLVEQSSLQGQTARVLGLQMGSSLPPLGQPHPHAQASPQQGTDGDDDGGQSSDLTADLYY